MNYQKFKWIQEILSEFKRNQIISKKFDGIRRKFGEIKRNSNKIKSIWGHFRRLRGCQRTQENSDKFW